MVTYPDGYYDRFDPTKKYERHLYRAGRVVQGAELNETQISVNDRIKRISDVLFKDGAVIRDAGIIVNSTTGYTQLAAGVIYARGAMRGVAPRNVTISITSTVAVGVFLQDSVVTEQEDPTLRDPAIALRNYSEPGAARLKVEAVWGVAGDGTLGDFYPIYTVINGEVQTTEPPAQIDALSLSIAAYDRDSTGGYYVVNGMELSMLDNDDSGNQVYSLAAGNARVNGRQVLLQHARRIPYTAVPDLKQVLSEPHNSSGGTERVNVNHWPIDTVDQILITTQKTTVVTHGAFNGISDILPDGSVVQIIAVNQGGTWNGATFTGGTTYTVGADYNLVSDSVSWSPAGAEPAPGSTYTVVYRYYATVTPTGLDSKGFTINGAVAGTTIQVSYRWRRPRIDRLCIDPQGMIVWVNGVPNDVSPRAPAVPSGILALANINQTWDETRSVVSDRTQVQSMAQLQGLEAKLDNLFALVGEQQLKTEAALSDPTTKRGTFYDNFFDDDMRDQGTTQNAAVIDGALTLPSVNVTVLAASLSGTQTLPLNSAGTTAVIAQTLRTGCLQVNPYMAFNPIPASCHIEPATDFWTDTQTIWLSPTTKRFLTQREVIDRTSSLGWLTRQLGVTTEVLVSSQTELVGSRTQDAEYLRQIVIAFTLQGFGPGEVLTTVKFDGISIPFTS